MRNQQGSHYNDFSEEIAEKICRPTERHVTSHVTDLDICELLIMDTAEEDSITISL